MINPAHSHSVVETPPPTPSDIARLTKLSRACTGIELGSDKTEFIRSRLEHCIRVRGLKSYAEYCSLLENSDAHKERAEFKEALTTNTTHFFRETGHFDWLRKSGLDDLIKAGVGRSRDLTIWSAACSTGQELFSALMTLAAHTKYNPINFKGIGTDLSISVLHSAKRAIYEKHDIKKIPEEYRHDYILSSKSSDEIFRISQELRAKAEWKQANLLDRSTIGEFEADIVFLRNVLIYFNGETQNIVLENVISKLRTGGILMTGHTETNSLRLRELRAIQPTIYQKVK